MEKLIGKEMQNLKNKYKFEYNEQAPYKKEKYEKIINSLFLNLAFSYFDSKFEEKLKHLRNIIHIKSFKEKCHFLDLKKKIDDLETNVEQLYDQIVTDNIDYTILVGQYEQSYEENRSKAGVLLVYNKIALDILTSVSDKCILYEKKLKEINNNIINLTNNIIK